MELTLINIIVLSAIVTFIVYLDDQFAGFDHKKSRYTRLFFGLSLCLWIFINKTIGNNNINGMNGMVAGSGIAAQQYSVGISPF